MICLEAIQFYGECWADKEGESRHDMYGKVELRPDAKHKCFEGKAKHNPMNREGSANRFRDNLPKLGVSCSQQSEKLQPRSQALFYFPCPREKGKEKEPGNEIAKIRQLDRGEFYVKKSKVTC